MWSHRQALLVILHVCVLLGIFEVSTLPLSYIPIPGPTLNSFMWSQPSPQLCMVKRAGLGLQLWVAITHFLMLLTLTLTSELRYSEAWTVACCICLGNVLGYGVGLWLSIEALDAG